MRGCFALFVPPLMLSEYSSPVHCPTYEKISKIETATPPHIVQKHLTEEQSKMKLREFNNFPTNAARVFKVDFRSSQWIQIANRQ